MRDQCDSRIVGVVWLTIPLELFGNSNIQGGKDRANIRHVLRLTFLVYMLATLLLFRPLLRDKV